MTNREKVIMELSEKGLLKEYDTINLGGIGFYMNYGTNIVKHNIAPTLTTQSNIAVVVKGDNL